ncbi:MAG: DUF1501 domain-containing protein [Proteobacteria bacterium]|nr:DUF1501 domain-containing protein [Pseudomonadota bacterium]
MPAKPSQPRVVPIFLGLFLSASAFASTTALADEAQAAQAKVTGPLVPKAPHFPARAKRVIYLFQSGAPSQMDLFDYKPLLNEKNGEQLPAHVRRGQRLTGMSVSQSSIPLAGSQFKFARHGRSGAWVSELLPHTSTITRQTGAEKRGLHQFHFGRRKCHCGLITQLSVILPVRVQFGSNVRCDCNL